MKSEKEFVGTLRGFDTLVNMVLDDVTEYDTAADGSKTTNKLDSILLNGNHVVMLVPGRCVRGRWAPLRRDTARPAAFTSACLVPLPCPCSSPEDAAASMAVGPKIPGTR